MAEYSATGAKAQEIQFSPTLTKTPEYMSLQAAAAWTGLAVDTLRRHARLGKLPIYRVGDSKNARIVVRISDLEAFIAPVPTVGTV
jgi:hypothetical protein